MSDYMVDQSTGSRVVRYKPVVVWIHWLTALLVVTQVAIGFRFFNMAPGPDRLEAFTWHKTVGAFILLLALARLAVRLLNPPPPYPAELPRWERFFAVWNHRIFYFFLIALPLTGLIAVSGKIDGSTPALKFGLNLPVIPGISEGGGEISGDLHIVLVFTTLALLVLHIGAALKHQFFVPNRVAGRMPPFRAPSSEDPVSG